MTEIPDHLLERTRSRRQALGLPVSGGGDGGAAAATPAAGGGGGGGAVAATGSNLPKGPVAPSGPAAAAAKPAKPLAPYIEASKRRTRIPVWAMPVVAILPLWAFLYAGTLEPPKKTVLTLKEAGAEVYSGAAACAGCHGATGGGGVGPQLSGGAAAETFPNPVDMVRWVILGSAGGADLYAAAGKQSKGGMPAFGETLSLTQIVEVVLHERQTLAGHDIAEDAEGWADLRELVEEFPERGYTEAEIDLIIEEIVAQEGVEIPAAE
ncbi:MAG: c-type cytochrome [Acidimicrobiales bacterium]|nr:c-type cytochrome [Acidimicrobiales bacterium]